MIRTFIGLVIFLLAVVCIILVMVNTSYQPLESSILGLIGGFGIMLIFWEARDKTKLQRKG